MARLIVLHIIEQFSGATTSLMQFVSLAKVVGRVAVLPSVFDQATDMTIYQGAAAGINNGRRVRNIDQYLNVSSFDEPRCPLNGAKTERVSDYLANSKGRLDAVVIYVHAPQHRHWFRPADEYGTMPCPQIWRRCVEQPQTCGDEFMWRMDASFIHEWVVGSDAPVLCVYLTRPVAGNVSFSSILKHHPALVGKESIAVLNWMGIDCDVGGRMCSKESFTATTHKFQTNCLGYSHHLFTRADSFIQKRLHQVSTYMYDAVHMRSEMLFYRNRNVEPGCLEHAAQEFMLRLKDSVKQWEGAWFLARDLAPGGSQTVREYVPESFFALEASVWANQSPAKFVELDDCHSDALFCALLTRMLLARARRMVVIGGGGFTYLTELLRIQLGKEQNTVSRIEFTPNCTVYEKPKRSHG